MADETKAYRVTVTNSRGSKIVAYVSAAGKQAYVRSMLEEYGNAEIDEISMDELPDGIEFTK